MTDQHMAITLHIPYEGHALMSISVEGGPNDGARAAYELKDATTLLLTKLVHRLIENPELVELLG